jgi:two-component system, OmpR family, phosphate regulon response regulator PhoB
MRKILLVEDDKSLGATLTERLKKENFDVTLAVNLKAAKDVSEKSRFDLVVLDVGLPDGSGFDFAKELRNRSSVPFIFVTAQVGAEERLTGYELGAEEYIPKPFHLKEFLIRVKHVLENHSSLHELKLGAVKIDFDSMVVVSGGETTRMNLKESLLLKLLIEKSPKVLSRDEILNKIWGEEEFPSNRTIDNVIVHIRQILGDKVGAYIKSVRGVGYQWIIED